jgi:hypothetical protein
MAPVPTPVALSMTSPAVHWVMHGLGQLPILLIARASAPCAAMDCATLAEWTSYGGIHHDEWTSYGGIHHDEWTSYGGIQRT